MINGQNISANYMLSAYNPGTYLIYSPIQKENGPRLFDPYFGFSYKGTNAWIKVYIFPSGQTNFTLTSSSITVSGNSWNTYLKNLTTVSYFSSVWNTNKEWQVCVCLRSAIFDYKSLAGTNIC